MHCDHYAAHFKKHEAHNGTAASLLCRLRTCQAHLGQQRCVCAQEMIDEADRDGDGEVNEEEFFRIMKKTSLF